MIKAIAGGGGRGMRIVDDAAKLEEAYARCQSEAMAAFGSDGVYVERLIRNARHIEVQIIGDHHGAISHLWERECTIQRRNQKLIEVAPSPSLSDALRARIIEAAKELAAAANYDNLGTFEFLVDNDARDERPGVRLHRGQSAAAGRAYRHRGGARHRSRAVAARGRGRRHARLARAGAGLYPEAARLCDAAPRQHGDDGRDRRDQADRRHARRCSTCRPAPAFASIRLAIPATGPAPPSTRCSPRSSCIRRAANWTDVVHKATRALREFRIGGVATNIPFLAAMLAHPDFVANRISTGFIDAHVADLVGAARRRRRRRRWSNPAAPPMTQTLALAVAASATGPAGSVAGAGAAAGHDRRDRGRGRRSRPPRPADRRARIHEDGASGHRAAWRQGDEGRGRSRRHADAGRGDPVSRAGRDRRP